MWRITQFQNQCPRFETERAGSGWWRILNLQNQYQKSCIFRLKIKLFLEAMTRSPYLWSDWSVIIPRSIPAAKIFHFGKNERTNEQTNERTADWLNKETHNKSCYGTNERISWRTDGFAKEMTYVQRHEWTNERRNEGTDDRRNERTNEHTNE